MQLDLPDWLNRYFVAQNLHDIDEMVACFAVDGAVRDEGHDIVGTSAIRAWIEETSAKYRITAEPIECRVDGAETIVLVKVSGRFVGSPANLSYRFRPRRRWSDRRAGDWLMGDRYQLDGSGRW